jgi:hypothetical protein
MVSEKAKRRISRFARFCHRHRDAASQNLQRVHLGACGDITIFRILQLAEWSRNGEKKAKSVDCWC